ncbi:hypothetical protein K2173_019420 [Erythroxylum novogranatense]|uniref:Uncharacterized protein n=1 Tax=Erythroxylum novogranatense TaxID=1862640 RepID=A0AAV8UBF3_9ROSI|nr:hypothetical protein K2173_019420 [Erythroxylum novogranatense]
MDVDNGDTDPSGFNSCALNSHNIELNKKRKLQGDQLGLPIPKHKCWGHQLPTEPLTRVQENQEIEDFFKHDLEDENSDRLATGYDCSHESANDNNSFVGDAESVSSLCGDSKFDSDDSKIWSSDAPSTSSFSFGCSSSTISQSYSDDTTGTSAGKEDACGGGKLDPVDLDHGFQITHYHEDSNLKFGSNADYTYPECGKELVDLYRDEELEAALHSNTLNPNIYVLSSGRWSLNQDSQPATRKPTIDQEFEQYFSTLML